MRTTVRVIKVFATMILVSAVGGCAGVRGGVKADHIDQPVSFTPCVYGATGNVIRTSERDTVKHFTLEKRSWAMLWSIVNLTPNQWDLSDELAREMASVNGDAIVNLTVEAQEDGWWFLSFLLPVIPDRQIVVVEGDVVRLTGKANAK